MKTDKGLDFIYKIEYVVFILLALLQVNFFNLPFIPDSLLSINSNIAKQLTLYLVVFAFIVWLPSLFSSPRSRNMISLSLSSVLLIVTVICLTILSSRAYGSPIFQTFRNGYYYWIPVYFFVANFLFRRYSVEMVKLIKAIGYIDLIVILAQDILFKYAGLIILKLDAFSSNSLLTTGRLLLDGDFLLAISFVILFQASLEHRRLHIGELLYLFFFAVHQALFAQGRVGFLIFLGMLAGYFVYLIVKLPFLPRIIVFGVYLVAAIIAFVELLRSMNFLGGTRAASGRVRLYEIDYFLGMSKLHGFWGIGFSNDSSLMNGGLALQNVWGGKYAISDVGLIGYLGIFGFLGIPFIISYLVQLLVLCLKKMHLGQIIIVLAYFIGQWGTLFPLNVSRIFLFSILSALIVYSANSFPVVPAEVEMKSHEAYS
ncbi:hypothetical protein [Lacticaseibacillus sp. 866-1]|uniref:hypothetical protein n=1 Tax=Lacticaseibacillus sp. 866-1 TaxID=2799576 RepID=UPI001940585A|nr:hypothetical protein [Lacticaseibacillus sp. 866-1]